MVRVGLWVKLEAKPGKESAVAEFLTGGLALAQQEPDTTVWFALRLGPSTFGIFDAFPSDAGRKAHLNGPIAAALMAKAADLLAKPPSNRAGRRAGRQSPGLIRAADRARASLSTRCRRRRPASS